MLFHKILIKWYLINKRELPWRQTCDPYRIWLSEIILQQTRVNQGLPYYLKFVEEFPDVYKLAEASEQKILKMWQGLGYYSRARNLHFTAKYIANELNGKFPGSYKELIKLKGVGDYTASAIASTCYKEAVPVLDGNVYRVLARYFGIDSPINTPAGTKEFKALAIELLDKEVPETYNQAVMEFGATQCKPQNPLCKSCPLAGSCIALRDRKISQLPVKLKTQKIKKRYFNYLVFVSEENKTLIEKRIGKGIWQGLYQFPLVETKKDFKAEDIVAEERFIQLAGEDLKNVTLYNDIPILHKLSHQHIFTHFWLIQKEILPANAIPVENLLDYPVPVLIANFLKECNIPEYNLPHPVAISGERKSNSDPAFLTFHSSDAKGKAKQKVPGAGLSENY